jgi:predicted AAA+ superfamily ATPase
MERIFRKIEPLLAATLKRGKSILLLGPRQVGKSTTVAALSPDKLITLARPALRQQYERDIEQFSQEIEAFAAAFKKPPLIAVDEVQKIPELMDAVQDLIDRQVAQFILTGSSARKLRHGKHINWLPGRVISFHMDPLSLSELPVADINLDDLLLYGSLPGIWLEPLDTNKEQDLESYVVTYLEEEIRQEALVRQIGSFAQFLKLAAAESGQIVNFNKLSQQIGVAQTTITGYYQLLEDCLIAERIEPLTESKVRRRLSKTPRYLMFDLGLRRLAAHEGTKPNSNMIGHLFEQFVGLELLRQIRLQPSRMELRFWRDLEGREVDWVIVADTLIPIEVKWTDKPSKKDAKHLYQFLDDYQLNHGYIVCRIDHDRKIDERIRALSWRNVNTIFNNA